MASPIAPPMPSDPPFIQITGTSKMATPTEIHIVRKSSRNMVVVFPMFHPQFLQ